MPQETKKGERLVVTVLLKEWEAVVLRTVQIHGRVYVKQLSKLLAEEEVPTFWGAVNPQRELLRLEEAGYLRSGYRPLRRGLKRQVHDYWLTAKGRKALEKYQKHLLELSRFIGNQVLPAVRFDD